MADGDPWYIQLLDRLGVNTTRLRWRIYQRQQQAKRLMQEGVGPSKILPWWSYSNKICPHCRAVNNHDARTCNSCGGRLPSMLGYRMRRILVGSIPKEGAVVSMAFFGLMLLVYGVQISLDGPGFRSIMSPSKNAIDVLGAFFRPFIDRYNEWWRFLSFGLVHGGLIHIGFNSYVLMQVGPMVESQLDRARMLALITCSQLTAAFACYVFSPSAPIVGASGWIFGLIGFGIVFAHRAGINTIRDSLIRWAIFILIFGFVINSYSAGGGVSNSAHIGGLVGGLAFGMAPEPGLRNDRLGPRIWASAGWVSAAMWLATIVFMVRSVIVYWPEIQGQ
jgi:rhomboid protease GluP